MKLLGKELLEKNWRQRGTLGRGGRAKSPMGGNGRRQPSSQPVFPTPPCHIPACPLPLPGSVHGPLWATSPASLNGILPSLHSVVFSTAGARGTGSERLTPYTHAHAHCGHNTSTQGCGSRTPEGAIYYPWHSGASRHLKLPWDGPLLARPGPNGSASSLLGPEPGVVEGTASLHSRHCLKENGDRVHLAGLWRDLPVWLSRFSPLL